MMPITQQRRDERRKAAAARNKVYAALPIEEKAKINPKKFRMNDKGTALERII